MITTEKEVINMMTVHEVSKISGVSIRALHHYDKIGLLPATKVTDAGYRLYDDTALERLQIRRFSRIAGNKINTFS